MYTADVSGIGLADFKCITVHVSGIVDLNTDRVYSFLSDGPGCSLELDSNEKVGEEQATPSQFVLRWQIYQYRLHGDWSYAFQQLYPTIMLMHTCY